MGAEQAAAEAAERVFVEWLVDQFRRDREERERAERGEAA